MPQIINGKEIAAGLRQKMREELSGTPKLVVITTVFADPASKVYMRNKRKAAEEIGILYEEIVLNENANQTAILALIRRLNLDPSVSGIIVQLPLPSCFDVKEIQRTIAPEKDVDGFHPNSDFLPCTPEAVIGIIEEDLRGKHCVVVGRSEIVGKPLARLLLQKNATVTQCHSYTSKTLLQTMCRNADYIFCAAGVPGLIRPDYLTPGKSTVIDISINRNTDGKLCGDLHEDAIPLTAAYTPVPGGVGPLTVAMLMQHVIKASHLKI